MGCRVVLVVAIFILIITSNEALGWHNYTEIESSTNWVGSPQIPKDEFNIIELPPHDFINTTTNGDYPLTALKLILLRNTYDDCCMSWSRLILQSELQDEMKRRYGKGRPTFKASDLLQELKTTFLNVTYLSIDGQLGGSERVKYYSYYDGVQYYLRLVKVARNYLNETTTSSVVAEPAEFIRHFRRQLNSIEYRALHDPVLTSFIRELGDLEIRENFELYEDFIRFTRFGQYYARNITMIRESVLVFDQIFSHLTDTDFPSNLTRPSMQYKVIRRMSYELYYIRNEIIKQISVRIRQNREDTLNMFAKLDQLAEMKPYIRMLGDEFSLMPSPNFSSHVKELTRLLDEYLSNSLTHVSFYDQLADLPQQFIILGSNIAHHYESKEIIYYDRFDFDYSFNTLSSKHNTTTSFSRTSSQNTTVARRIGRMMSSIFDF